ncbi:ABC transporter permease [Tropicibacter naphthalenivorans]|uniref:Autoinducer 2 import system permease protein LsrD n=1 Tax=Tropicibacter naphthalenivorans TaxID=441103 RepID=A0A0N7M0K9_9RHOB|nr:ABC transporter permease [Tropicibacter naphthalenivorans]CUH80753.1 D-allose transport system permease protein AlsC [Tropicibacter naphthalenivorans]SMC90017.1 mannose ABC transporter membrane protein /fructose ABC transporter membrane protein /ribose ABC transporter membrane protein [Tropicibacter naphthalenivorans]
MAEPAPQRPGGQDFEQTLNQSDTNVARFENTDRTFLKSLQHFLHGNPTIVPVVILILGIVGFAVVTDGKFLSLYNMNVILQRVSIVGTLAAAQTLVILTAGIDLSIGALMVLMSMAMGHLAVSMGVPAPLAVLIGLGGGGLCGFLNGLLVTKVKLPPFITTLGTWRIFYALIFMVFGSQSIRGGDIDKVAPLLKFWGNVLVLGPVRLTYGSILLFVIFFVLWYVLTQTAWGRHVYAVGDDAEAAELSGMQSDRVLRQVYIVAGVVGGLAAWMAIGRLGSASPTSFAEANLESITAVVIGGISLFGGRGSIWGVFFGAIIVQVFDAGLSMTSLDTQAKYMALGVLIIVAVAMDQWIRKVSA